MKTKKNEKVKNKLFSHIKEQYDAKQAEWKAKIKAEPKKGKRFWKWVWYWIAFPWVWLFYNIRDWRSAICILISLIVWSGTVWVPWLISLLCGWTSTTAGKWWFAVGSTVWIWWLSPMGSPFILLVTVTGIGIKIVFDKIRSIREKHLVECSKCGTKRIEKRCVRVYDAEQDKFVYVCPKCTRAVTKGK